MNHRPFEDWLLAEDPLTSDQKADLQDHLKTCTSCQAMAEVNLVLRTKKVVAPAPGFTNRFQSKLVFRRSAQRRRNLAGILILVISALAIIVALFFPYVAWVVNSPLEVFVTWVTTLSLIVSSLLAYGKAGSVMLRVASGFIPIYLWVAVFAITGLAGLLWVASIRKFAPNFEGVKDEKHI
jgi:hypothetical protein